MQHSDRQQMMDELNAKVQEKLRPEKTAVRWFDGGRHHVGHRLIGGQVGGRSLVVSFGEVYLVPTKWLIDMPMRTD